MYTDKNLRKFTFNEPGTISHQVYLTDGNEFYDQAWLNDEELKQANQRAFEATDGNLYWSKTRCDKVRQ